MIAVNARRLSLYLLLSFAIVSGGLSWWQVVDAQALASRQDNPEVVAARRTQPRGAIFDAQGRLLASSRLVDGISRRTYRDPAFSHVKLNKILCMSDCYAYAKLGHPMTGATYRAGEAGPVADELGQIEKALIDRGEATRQVRDFCGKTHQRLVPLRAPDLDRL